MKFAIVTPSYQPDFERCRLLCETVNRHVRGDWRHYVIVDRRDRDLFREVAGPRTEVVVKEQVLPRWVRRVPLQKRWWWSWKSLPIRGWIIQQLIKIGVGDHIDADAYLFVDSDLAFCRPCDVGDFVRGGKLRLFRAPGAAREESQFRWHRTAARLLGLPVRDYFGATYIGAMVTWRRDHLREMYGRIREATGKNWVLAASRQLHLAEYILYGVYVEHVLGGGHAHFFDDSPICQISWEYDIRTDADIERFFDEVRPEHVAVMFSSKLHIPVEKYRHLLPG